MHLLTQVTILTFTFLSTAGIMDQWAVMKTDFGFYAGIGLFLVFFIGLFHIRWHAS